jgi:hypothetical protein
MAVGALLQNKGPHDFYKLFLKSNINYIYIYIYPQGQAPTLPMTVGVRLTYTTKAITVLVPGVHQSRIQSGRDDI